MVTSPAFVTRRNIEVPTRQPARYFAEDDGNPVTSTIAEPILQRRFVRTRGLKRFPSSDGRFFRPSLDRQQRQAETVIVPRGGE